MSPIFVKFTGKLIMVLAVTLALIFGVVRCHDSRPAEDERLSTVIDGAVTDSAIDASGTEAGSMAAIRSRSRKAV